MFGTLICIVKFSKIESFADSKLYLILFSFQKNLYYVSQVESFWPFQYKKLSIFLPRQEIQLKYSDIMKRYREINPNSEFRIVFLSQNSKTKACTLDTFIHCPALESCEAPCSSWLCLDHLWFKISEFSVISQARIIEISPTRVLQGASTTGYQRVKLNAEIEGLWCQYDYKNANQSHSP